jgi:hypothetical protein
MRIRKSWFVGAAIAGMTLAASASVALPRDMTVIEYYTDATYQEPAGLYVELCSGRRNTAGVVTSHTKVFTRRCYTGIEYNPPSWYGEICTGNPDPCNFD